MGDFLDGWLPHGIFACAYQTALRLAADVAFDSVLRATYHFLLVVLFTPPAPVSVVVSHWENISTPRPVSRVSKCSRFLQVQGIIAARIKYGEASSQAIKLGICSGVGPFIFDSLARPVFCPLSTAQMPQFGLSETFFSRR